MKSSLSRRYARALFELLDASEVDQMRAGLLSLSEAFSESAALKHVVASPAFSAEEKTAVLSALSKRAGCPAAIEGFFSQVVAKSRVDQLPAIAESFAELADEAKGVQRVAVTSAVKLAKADEDRIHQQLRGLMQGPVVITYDDDPKLLSGLRIQIGSTVYDSSVRNRLDTMRAMLAKE